jgi:hypothetical protein
LKLLSWNIRHGGGKRIANIIDRIIGHNPDIAVLPEFRHGAGGDRLREALHRHGLPYQVASAAPEKANGVLVASRTMVGDAAPLDRALDRPHLLLC